MVSCNEIRQLSSPVGAGLLWIVFLRLVFVLGLLLSAGLAQRHVPCVTCSVLSFPSSSCVAQQPLRDVTAPKTQPAPLIGWHSA